MPSVIPKTEFVQCVLLDPLAAGLVVVMVRRRALAKSTGVCRAVRRRLSRDISISVLSRDQVRFQLSTEPFHR